MIRWTKGDRLDEKDDKGSMDQRQSESKNESRSKSRLKRDERVKEKLESTKGLSDRFDTRGELHAVGE